MEPSDKQTEYLIRTGHTDKCLQAIDGVVVQQAFNGHISQRWVYDSINGIFSSVAYPKLVISIQDEPRLTQRLALALKDLNDLKQQWTLGAEGIVTSKANVEFCWDIAGSETQRGAPLQLSTVSDRLSQRFKLEIFDPASQSKKKEEFLIVAMHSELCLEITSNESGAAVKQGFLHGLENQRWTMGLDGRIINVKTGLCLTPLDSSLDDGNSIVVEPFDENNPYQKWKHIDKKGHLGIIDTDRKCLEVIGGSKEVGARVLLTTLSGGDHQRFKIVPFINQFTYLPFELKERYVIVSLHARKVLDCEHVLESSKSKRPLRLAPYSASLCQIWRFGLDGRIASDKDGWVITVDSEELTDGAPLVVSPRNRQESTQAWKFGKRGIFQAIANEDKAISINSGSMQTGSRLALFSKKNAANHQRFSVMTLEEARKCFLEKNIFSPFLVDSFEKLPLISEFLLVAEHSQKCLDIKDGKKEDGTNVVQNAINGSETQRWRADGEGRLISCCTGKALAIRDGKVADEAIICIEKASDSLTQKWVISNDGFVSSQQEKSYVLTVFDGKLENGVVAVLNKNDGKADQMFRLEIPPNTVSESKINAEIME